MIKKPILYNVEGPKGSGKSTLLNAMAKDYSIPKDQIVHFTNEKYVTSHNIVEMVGSLKDPTLVDRGLVSSAVYGFLYDSKISIVDNELEWQVITLSDFQFLMDSIKNQLVILYASDVNLLFQRIELREQLTNKGATEFEYSMLERSNLLYQFYGTLLKELFPDKVAVFDVCSYSTKEIIDELRVINNE